MAPKLNYHVIQRVTCHVIQHEGMSRDITRDLSRDIGGVYANRAGSAQQLHRTP